MAEGIGGSAGRDEERGATMLLHARKHRKAGDSGGRGIRLNDAWGIARHQLAYYEQTARSIEKLALYRASEATLTGDSVTRFAERAPVAVVSASIFDVLGIVPDIGRPLTAEDNLLRAPSRAVISHDL